MNRLDMEKQWRKRGIAQIGNVCCWNEHGSAPGAARNPTTGAEALKFRAATTGERGWPAWSKSQPRDIEPSEELKVRYRMDCPNNAAALIASFGKTRTKYDAPLTY